MKTSNTIIINAPMKDVWKIVATDFDKAHLWMGPVKDSYAIGKGENNNGAGMQGRICHFTDNPDNAKAREFITGFSEAGKTISFEVNPVNVPGVLPMVKNDITISLVELADNKTKVLWTSQPTLKPLGYLFYPLLKLAIPLLFSTMLKGLKNYSEGQASLSAKTS